MDGETGVELQGPKSKGWYSTRVRDWIGVCPDLRDADVRGYLVLRSLVIDKFEQRVRKLTLAVLCELIPGPNGKSSSLTRVRGIITNLSAVGLLSTPEGQPIKTSSRASAANKTIRIQINDLPAPGYRGWQNTEQALAAAEKKAPVASNDASEAGRKNDPRSRKNDPDSRADQQEPDHPLVSPVGLPLSPEAAGEQQPEGSEAGDERENAAPTDKPATPSPLPAQREDLPDTNPDAEQVLAAYEDALGAKALNGTRTRLLADAADLLASRPLWWVIDRARELPKYGSNLAKHAEMSKAPVKQATRRTPLPAQQDDDYTPVSNLSERSAETQALLAALRQPKF